MKITRILPIAFVFLSACGSAQKELDAASTNEALNKTSTQTAAPFAQACRI